MLIEVDEFYYAQDYGILGRVGERGCREIHCEFPKIDGAQIYKLRFELSPQCCYEVDITSGTAQVPPSLLARKGPVKTQFIAAASDGEGSYVTIAKSNIFYCMVSESIESEVKPVPTYEDAVDALDKLKDALEGHEVKSQIMTPEEYEATQPHDPNTLYYVVDDGKVEQYLGDAKLGGGSGSSFSAAGIISEFVGGKAVQGNYTNEETEE